MLGLVTSIEATDREIDGIAYELYGLTDEEIAIVEEATAGERHLKLLVAVLADATL